MVIYIIFFHILSTKFQSIFNKAITKSIVGNEKDININCRTLSRFLPKISFRFQTINKCGAIIESQKIRQIYYLDETWLTLLKKGNLMFDGYLWNKCWEMQQKEKILKKTKRK